MSYNIYNATTDSLEKVSGRVANGILNTLDEVKESASDNVASGSLAVKELAECNDYSTEEQAIGKWIDGKTIYRKTFQIDMSSAHTNVTSVAHNISNIDKVLNIYGFLIRSDGYGFSINSYSSTSYFSYTAANKTNIEYRNVGWVGMTYVTLEYTKTTD